MQTEFQTGMSRENSLGTFFRFIKDVAQMPYFTPKMGARYAFFFRERSIFNLWQISIISMADFHRERGRVKRVLCFVFCCSWRSRM
jgi:hypothetical protein